MRRSLRGVLARDARGVGLLGAWLRVVGGFALVGFGGWVVVVVAVAVVGG